MAITQDPDDGADLEVRLSPADLGALVISEVTEGLARTRASLPLDHLTDRFTNERWADLATSDAYYQARCERGLVSSLAPAALEASQADTVVMLGIPASGAAEALLTAAHDLRAVHHFVAVDLLAPAVEECCRQVTQRYPEITSHGIVADPIHQVDQVAFEGSCLVLISGPAIGRLDARTRARFFAHLASALQPDDTVLLAADLAKDHRRLVASYDDPQGHHAARTRNALVVLARELGAALDPDGWRHVALWDEQDQSVEVALQAEGEQVIAIESLNIDRHFADGELVELERNRVFLRNGLDAQLALAGLHVSRWWTDPSGDYALSLASV